MSIQTKDLLTDLVLNQHDLKGQMDLLKQLSLEKIDTDTLAFAVEFFRSQMFAIDLGKDSEYAIDMAGTGGDKSGTFNISTTSALVAAAAGAKIAKHGNVSISSKSGGIDLLRALHVYLPEAAEDAINYFQEHGLVFLFAQHYHPTFKNFTAARKELADNGVITLFNILGPLLNPAKVKRCICGVFRADLLEMMAGALKKTGAKKALIVHGSGLDELSITGDNLVLEINEGTIQNHEWSPETFGFKRADISHLQGGTPEENAAITKGILYGDIKGPKKDIVSLNAGAALYVSADEYGLADCIDLARATIENGKAATLLEGLGR